MGERQRRYRLTALLHYGTTLVGCPSRYSLHGLTRALSTMAADIATALIAAGGATILAVVTYGLTKKREREADLRKERLAHYKDFIASLSGVITGEDTPDGQRAFARACNNLNLVAPQQVIQALQTFRDEIRASNTNKNRERHDQLLSRLLFEIRRDLGIWPKDSQDFKVELWASGSHTNQSPQVPQVDAASRRS